MRIKSLVHVCNLQTRSGSAVPNQFEIQTNEGRYFQSYRSLIAFVDNTGSVTLTDDWDYSCTTMRYLSQFLNGVNSAEIHKRLKSGEYKLG
jgi:hypothetical protein